MAEKRMFSKKITDSDAFIEMSSAAQALYFHLNQSADDDGFNNQIQLAMLKSHASVDDLKVLLLKNFLIRFESGVIVIKHWRMHNTLRKDRHTPTSFQEELARLNIKDNLSYTLTESGCQMVAERLPDGCRSIDKISIDKIREDKEYIETSFPDVEPEKVKTNFNYYIDSFNSICISLPKVVKNTEKRKKAINAIRKVFADDEILKAFSCAESSDFLTNRNGKGFSAGFDWIMVTGNMTKVLEGNYDNKKEGSNSGQHRADNAPSPKRVEETEGERLNRIALERARDKPGGLQDTECDF